MSQTKLGRKKDNYLGERKVEEVYRTHVAPPKVEPHCNCEGAFNWVGKKVTSNVQYGFAVEQITKLADDKETCAFCGHYVLWQEESNYGKPKSASRRVLSDSRI
jgi:hypothetical protein